MNRPAIDPSITHVPLPSVPGPRSPWRTSLELWITLFAVVCTAAATAMAGFDLLLLIGADIAERRWAQASLHLVFALIVAVLVYGAFVYQLARMAYVWRRCEHRPAPRETVEALFDGAPRPLTVLIPSYMEDPEIVFTTLMSAALQDYPERRVVLLIDDSPTPRNAADARLLAEARQLPKRVTDLLSAPALRFRRELEAFDGRLAAGAPDLAYEARRLAFLHLQAARWFQACRRNWRQHDRADALFCERVLATQANTLRARAHELRSGLPAGAGPDLLRRHYRHLAALFTVEVSCFERKRYVNLSHEPNKAMNLNSYIGLLGGRYRECKTEAGLTLEQVAAHTPADLVVAHADYLITLDADSIILPDYALRLTYEMERPHHQRLAVIQTPYSAVPGAPNTLERIAGATTDIQYIIHQGFTGFRATYWVGANALIRVEALADIAEPFEERGYRVVRYIQDRTVIEDTESSIDLIANGWRLHNFPERLAYSATPPDFGSLLIQRRRWANGGLIILPKLLRYLGCGPDRLTRLPQAFMRIHYLVSIALVNAGLLLILAVPMTEAVTNYWLPLTALPYFALYARDLVQLGYRLTDILRVYALNLVLIPVNLGGVLKSLQQAWTGEKIPFGRTPKIKGRTAAAWVYVAAVWALVLWWYVGAASSLVAERWVHGGFVMANATMLLYGAVVFIGLRASAEDLRAALPARQLAKPTHAHAPDPGLGTKVEPTVKAENHRA